MNLNRYDLISLRLFVSVVELGSLTLGAKEFGISLAAASKRISEMEAHVGQALLLRSKKGVVPSPAVTFNPHRSESARSFFGLPFGAMTPVTAPM